MIEKKTWTLLPNAINNLDVITNIWHMGDIYNSYIKYIYNILKRLIEMTNI